MTDSRPAFGSAPAYGQPAAAGPVARPRTVEIAFWLYLAAAVLDVISAIISLTGMGGAIDAAKEQASSQGQELPEGALDAAIGAGIAIGVAFSVVLIAATVVFAILMRRGFGWARWVLLVLAVLSLLGVFGGVLGILHTLCMVAATVLVFLRPSTEYFRAVTAAKRAGRAF
jgi:hypothetical protein